ncbi:MAG: tRNA pseudouridine(55) synthase TruB [Mariprofundaceae bacterium]|nr:tRNA pseudouridine(55) synthase TruB [Mariprofundaceae bacterium]
MPQTEHPCGVVFLDKPQGWTSRKAVNFVIRCFAKPQQKNRKQRPKAGHAGTLDPLATGMLPILLGEATKFASMGLNAEKCYEVSIDLSFQTNTLDLEGEVLQRCATEHVDEDAIHAVLEQFRGLQQQVPPAFSAIRVDGKRAHALARKGEEVILEAREITIHKLEFLSFSGCILSLKVDCSKGTYIRSLARDIGLALACGGCVTALRRVSSGGWAEAMMVSVAELEERKEACMLPLPKWLRDLPTLRLDEAEAKRFVQGQRVVLADEEMKAETSVLSCILWQETMLGTGTLQAKTDSDHAKVLQPQRVLPSAQEIWNG